MPHSTLNSQAKWRQKLTITALNKLESKELNKYYNRQKQDKMHLAQSRPG